ncbi:MAG: hypothetical protein ACI8P9_001043 [Parasphingorhabdus sp.]|jgi:hypothetical protein
MEELQLAWHIAKDGNEFGLGLIFRIAIGAVVLALGLAGLIRKIQGKSLPKQLRFGTWFCLAFGAIWLYFHWTLMSAEIEETALHAAKLESQDFEVVEGVVKVLHEQPATGHAKGDVIEIAGKQFEINYFVMAPGYKNTLSNGGVLQDGVYAKLKFSGNTILSVEIK